MPTYSATVPVPANSNIRLTGFANSGEWAQLIKIQPPKGGDEITWTGKGGPNNQVIGQCTLGPYAEEGQSLVIAMSYDSGAGWQASEMKVDSYNMAGLSGYVVGGQDGGGRPYGPAFWNTVLFIYWASGY